jgi:hypothetical protein
MKTLDDLLKKFDELNPFSPHDTQRFCERAKMNDEFVEAARELCEFAWNDGYDRSTMNHMLDTKPSKNPFLKEKP